MCVCVCEREREGKRAPTPVAERLRAVRFVSLSNTLNKESDTDT